MNRTTAQNVPLASPILHVSPFTKGIALDKNSRFAYHAQGGEAGFAYVHSGYSFGGHRFEEKLYPNGKPFGPEDCSSWVAKMTRSKQLFSTADQFHAYKLSVAKGDVAHDIDKSSRVVKEILKDYAPVPIEEVRPGDLFVLRSFKMNDPSKDKMDNLGISGHTGIVLERKGDTLITGEYSRDMANNRDGFGIRERRLESSVFEENSEKLLVFQRLKQI